MNIINAKVFRLNGYKVKHRINEQNVHQVVLQVHFLLDLRLDFDR